jgi:hypothetical protein
MLYSNWLIDTSFSTGVKLLVPSERSLKINLTFKIITKLKFNNNLKGLKKIWKLLLN